MNLIQLLMAVYYKGASAQPRKRITPYLITLISFSIVLWMNITTIFLLMGWRDVIFHPLVSLGLLVLILPLILFLFAKKNFLQNAELTEKQIDKGKQYLIGWLVLSMLMIVIASEVTK